MGRKIDTDQVYFVKLCIVTGYDYTNEDEIVKSKFLKWIAVIDNSSDYHTDFIDMKTKINYSNRPFEIGSLFVDLDSIVCVDTITGISKLEQGQIFKELEVFKRSNHEKEIKDEIQNYKLLKKLITSIDKEKLKEILNDYDEEVSEEIKEEIKGLKGRK